MRKRVSILLAVFILLSVFIFSQNNSPQELAVEGVIQRIILPAKTHILPKNNVVVPNKSVAIEKMLDYELVKKDNAALRSQFQEESVVSYHLLPANVVGHLGNSENPEILIIDQGKSDGIRVNMSVVFEKYLVGKIIATSPHISQVELITAPGFSTLAVTLKDSALGVIHGEGDFVILDQVVITDTLSKDDLVMTRGNIDSSAIGVKTSLIVGKIDSISKVESRPFQHARITPLIDYSRLYKVFVVKAI